jgi:hypothetical protein
MPIIGITNGMDYIKTQGGNGGLLDLKLLSPTFSYFVILQVTFSYFNPRKNFFSKTAVYL